MLDLLIINPGAAHGIKGGHAIYGDLGATLVAKEPPLWARLIAGYVRDRGFSVSILDAEALDCTPETVAIVPSLRYAPRLVCICVFGHQPSASTQQMDGASRTAAAIKELYPNQKIIMVGGHVAALPAETLHSEPIDYACNGEGPVTIVGLLQQLPEHAIPGLVYWYNFSDKPLARAPKINNAAPLIPVEELHGDVWDLLPMHLYRAHNWQCFGDLAARQPYASIYTSLGCPYRCSFCCIQAPFSPDINGNRYRMRKPKAVVNELVHLWQIYGVKTVKIVDEMFVLNPRHYVEIAERIVAAKTKGDLPDDLNLWSYARVDTVKEGHLPLLRAAGMQWLALGIESGSKHVRDGAEKALKHDDIVGTVRAIQEAGINVIGNFITGLPDDDMASMQETLGLALELRCEFVNVYSAMAYPGSALYQQALREGWKLPATFKGFSQHNKWCRPLDTAKVTAREIVQFRDHFFQTYYTDPQYLDFIEKKFGAGTRKHVEGMTTYRLERYLVERPADVSLDDLERVF